VGRVNENKRYNSERNSELVFSQNLKVQIGCTLVLEGIAILYI